MTFSVSVVSVMVASPSTMYAVVSATTIRGASGGDGGGMAGGSGDGGGGKGGLGGGGDGSGPFGGGGGA